MNDDKKFQNILAEIEDILPTYRASLDSLRSQGADSETLRYEALYDLIFTPERVPLEKLSKALELARAFVSTNSLMRRNNELIGSPMDRCYSPTSSLAPLIHNYHHQSQSQMKREDYTGSRPGPSPLLWGGVQKPQTAATPILTVNQTSSSTLKDYLKSPPLTDTDIRNLLNDTNETNTEANTLITDIVGMRQRSETSTPPPSFEIVRQKLQKLSQNTNELAQQLPTTNTPNSSKSNHRNSAFTAELPTSSQRCKVISGDAAVASNLSNNNGQARALPPMAEERLALKYKPHPRQPSSATVTSSTIESKSLCVFSEPSHIGGANMNAQRPMDPRSHPQQRNSVYTASEMTDRHSHTVPLSFNCHNSHGNRHNRFNYSRARSPQSGQFLKRTPNAVKNCDKGDASLQASHQKEKNRPKKKHSFRGQQKSNSLTTFRSKDFPGKSSTATKERDFKSRKEDSSYETKEKNQQSLTTSLMSKPPIESNLDKLYRSSNFESVKNMPKTNTNFKIPKKSFTTPSKEQHPIAKDREMPKTTNHTKSSTDTPKGIGIENPSPSVIETKTLENKEIHFGDSEANLARRKTRSIVSCEHSVEETAKNNPNRGLQMKRASTPQPHMKRIPHRRKSVALESLHNDWKDGTNRNLANIFEKTDDNSELSTQNIISTIRRTRPTKNFNEVAMMNELFKQNQEDSRTSPNKSNLPVASSSRKQSPDSPIQLTRARCKTPLKLSRGGIQKECEFDMSKQRPSRSAPATPRSRPLNTSKVTANAVDETPVENNVDDDGPSNMKKNTRAPSSLNIAELINNSDVLSASSGVPDEHNDKKLTLIKIINELMVNEKSFEVVKSVLKLSDQSDETTGEHQPIDEKQLSNKDHVTEPMSSSGTDKRLIIEEQLENPTEIVSKQCSFESAKDDSSVMHPIPQLDNSNDAENKSNSETHLANGRTSRIQRKKRKNELDRLNEDINDMFIKDDVMAASGKRVCTLHARASPKTGRSLPDETLTNPRVSSLRHTEEPVRSSSRLRAAAATPPLVTSRKENAQSTREELLKRRSYTPTPGMELNLRSSRRQLAKGRSFTPTQGIEFHLQNWHDTNNDEDDLELTDLENQATRDHNQPPKEPPLIELDDNDKDNSGRDGSGAPAPQPIKMEAVDAVTNTNCNWHCRSEFVKKCVVCDINFPDGNAIAHYSNVHRENYVSRLPSAELLGMKRNTLKGTRPKLGYHSGRSVVWIFKCPFCLDTKRTTAFDLLEHFSEHTAENIFVCTNCDTAMKNRKSGSVHLRDKCPTGQIRSFGLNRTQATEFEITVEVCHLCNYMQFNRRNLNEHYIKQHFSEEKNIDSMGYRLVLFSTTDDLIVDKKEGEKLTIEEVARTEEDKVPNLIEPEKEVLTSESSRQVTAETVRKDLPEANPFPNGSETTNLINASAKDVTSSTLNEISVNLERVEKENVSTNIDMDMQKGVTAEAFSVETDRDKSTENNEVSNKRNSAVVSSEADNMTLQDKADVEEKKSKIKKKENITSSPVKDIKMIKKNDNKAQRQTFSDSNALKAVKDNGPDQIYARPSVIQMRCKDSIVIFGAEKNTTDTVAKSQDPNKQVTSASSENAATPQPVEEPVIVALAPPSACSALDFPKDSLEVATTPVGNSNAFMSTQAEPTTSDSPLTDIFTSNLLSMQEDAETNVTSGPTSAPTPTKSGEGCGLSMAERLSQRLKTFKENTVQLERVVEEPKTTTDIKPKDGLRSGIGDATILIEDDDGEWEDIEVVEPVPTKRPNLLVPHKTAKQKHRNKFNKLLKTNKTLNATQRNKKNAMGSISNTVGERDHHSNSNSCESTLTCRSGSDRATPHTNEAVPSGSNAFLPLPFPKAMIANLNDLLPDSPCNDPIDLVPELAPMEPLQDLNDISSILNSNLSSATQQRSQTGTTTFSAEPQGDSNEQQATMEEALDFIRHEQQQQYDSAAPIITIPSPSSPIYRVHNVGYSKSSDENNLKFYCLCKPCSFIFSSEAIGLETHFKADHPLNKWNGFCGTCNGQVKSCPNGPSLHISEEIQHMLDFHAQPGLRTTPKQYIVQMASIPTQRMESEEEKSPSESTALPTISTSDRPRIQVRCLPGDWLSKSTIQRNNETPKLDGRIEEQSLCDLLNAQQRPITKQPHPVFSITEPLLCSQDLIVNAIETEEPIYTNVSTEFAITSVTSAGPLELPPPQPATDDSDLVPLQISNVTSLNGVFTTPANVPPAPIQQQQMPPSSQATDTDIFNMKESPLQIKNFYSLNPDVQKESINVSVGLPWAQQIRDEQTQLTKAYKESTELNRIFDRQSSLSPIGPSSSQPPRPKETLLSQLLSERDTESPGPLVVSETVPLSTSQTGDYLITQSLNADYRHNGLGLNIEIVSPRNTNLTQLEKLSPALEQSHNAMLNTNNVRSTTSVSYTGQRDTMTSTDEITQKIRRILSGAPMGGDKTTQLVNQVAADEPQVAQSQLINNASTDEDDLVDTIEEMVGSKGLPNHKLYACVMPDCSTVLDEFGFVPHLTEHLKQIRSVGTPSTFTMKCRNCTNCYQRPIDMKTHLMLNHARHYYFCYVCCETAPSSRLLGRHFSKMHWNTPEVQSEILCRKICPNQTDSVYFVSHSSALSRTDVEAYGKRLKLEWQRKKASNQTHYKPSDVDLLPPQPIFKQEISCAECKYKTKVRSNMARHLQAHKSPSKQMANVDPVNPVPCLNTSERHFDKMTNLASSSLVTNTLNASGAAPKVPIKIPYQYVEETKRFTCGIPSCVHLTSTEELFRAHLNALHGNVMSYKCPFCMEELCRRGIVADRVTQHLKYHGKHLYECEQCHYLHYHKGTMERHINEKHSTIQVNMIMYKRDTVGETNGTTSQILKTGKKFKDPTAIVASATTTVVPSASHSSPCLLSVPSISKPSAILSQPVSKLSKHILKPSKYKWECAHCQHLTERQQQMLAHCMAQHQVQTMYQCGHCDFGASLLTQIQFHQNGKHETDERSVRQHFHKLQKPKPAPAERIGPLWQRDDPNRVRHIRGIQIENEEESARHQNHMGTEELDAVKSGNDDDIVLVDPPDVVNIAYPPEKPSLMQLLLAGKGPKKDMAVKRKIELKDQKPNAKKEKKHDTNDGGVNSATDEIQGVSTPQPIEALKNNRGSSKTVISPPFFYTCSQCNYAASSLLELVNNHWLLMHKETNKEQNNSSDSNSSDFGVNIFTFSIQNQFKCPVCFTFVGFHGQLKEHSRSQHSLEFCPATDPISLERTVLLCGHCEYVATHMWDLQEHYKKAQHHDTDLKFFTQDHLDLVLKMNCGLFSYYHCSQCSLLFSDLSTSVEHICNTHKSRTNLYKNLRDGEVLYMCTWCNHVSKEPKRAMHHMIDHYERFKWCHFCRIDQKSFKSYMQHSYVEHRAEIKEFNKLYPVDDIIGHLEELYVLFPNGLKLSLRNLALTKFHHRETMREVYEEICKTSREPPIPPLIISRLTVPHKANDAFAIAAVPMKIAKRRQTLAVTENIFRGSYAETPKAKIISDLPSHLVFRPPSPRPQPTEPPTKPPTDLSHPVNVHNINDKADENTGAYKPHENNKFVDSKIWQPRVVVKNMNMTQYAIPDCVDGFMATQKACPASRKKRGKDPVKT